MAENPDISTIRQTIEGLASNANAEERVEKGPGAVEPAVETANQSPFVPVPMAEEECAKWWERIERSRTRRDNRSKRWDILLKEYLPIVAETGKAETIKYNGHFRNVHSKLPQLFFRTPDLILTPRDPGPSTDVMPNPMAQMNPAAPPMLSREDIVILKQSVLDDTLGRDGIKAGRLMDEMLFDVLAWTGISPCLVGYRCVQKDYQKPVMVPDPTFVPPPPQGILGLGPTPQAPMVPHPEGKTTTETATIYEDWFARRFSPKKLLLPDDLYSTRYDEDATWKGMEFFMSPDRIKRMFGKSEQNPDGLSEEEINKAAEDNLRATYEEDNKASTGGLVRGVQIYCKSEYYTSPDKENWQPHPLAFHQLILIEGVKTRPVVWRPCPDQTFNEKGELTPDSIDKNPIQVLATRDLADSPYPESDAAFANQNVKTIGTWRRQSVALRDRAIGKYFYDLDAFDEGDIDKLKNAEIGDYIGVEAGKLDKGADKILVPTAKVTSTPDDYRNAQLLKNDMDEVIGVSPATSGSMNDTIHTATEVSTATSFGNGRNEKEKSRVTDFYLDIARMLDQLLMRYATTDRYTTVLGEAGAQSLQVWNAKMISGRYLYDISPDSSHSLDSAQDFQLSMALYNLANKDPQLNRGYMLKRLARMRGLDPNKAVLPPPVPKPPMPEPLKPSFAFKPEDIILLMAQNDPTMQALAELLITLLGQAVQKPGVQQIPGPTIEPANKHEAGKSGGKENAPGAINHRGLPGKV